MTVKELKPGMVFKHVYSPKGTFMEYIGKTNCESYDGTRKDVYQFSIFSKTEDDIISGFYDNEIKSFLRTKKMILVNDWQSRRTYEE